MGPACAWRRAGRAREASAASSSGCSRLGCCAGSTATNWAGSTATPAPPRRSEPRATSPARRSALGVELAGEVFEAAVDLEGDDPMAGAEAAGDLRRRDEVGAGRRAGEDPLGAGGLARHRERGRFGDGDDLVEVLGGEHRRPAPDAAALDMVDARDPAGQHRRLRWLHDRSMQTRQRDQRAAGAEETASGPDVAAERVDGRWTG